MKSFHRNLNKLSRFFIRLLNENQDFTDFLPYFSELPYLLKNINKRSQQKYRKKICQNSKWSKSKNNRETESLFTLLMSFQFGKSSPPKSS